MTPTPEEPDARLKAELPALAAPESLRERVRLALRAEAHRPPNRYWVPAAVAAALVFAVSGTWYLTSRTNARAELAQQVLASHLRSLQPGHLVDVSSNNTHNVKPWFNGKVNFSPPVADPEPDSFPLIGGRLDYMHGRTVAALVYQRRLHVINVFVWPEGGSESLGERSENGYNEIYWKKGGWEFWVVSDLNAAELKSFVTEVREGGRGKREA
jgi:anti-sigma factor RsiW